MGLGRAGHLPIDSSEFLEFQVDSHDRSLSGSLIADPELGPGPSVRALEVLLEVARATPFSAEEPIRTIRQLWPLMKYIGMFEEPDPDIRLSESAQLVRGNARRLFSEELGVGFARYVARHFVRTHAPNLSLVRIEDVDHLDQDSSLAQSLEYVTKQRPDYFLVASDPRRPTDFKVFVLEAKGSMSRTTSVGQLAKASRQVRAVTIDGQSPDGLACSTVLSESELIACALRVSDNFGTFAADGVQAQVDPASVRDSAETIEEVTSARRDSQRTVSTSLLTSWMRLGRFAGDEAVEQTWRSSLGEEFLAPYRSGGSPQVSVEVEGELATGTQAFVDTPEGRIELFLGVNNSVLAALRSGDSEAVLRTQADFALRHEQRGDEISPAEVSALDEEGAVARVAVTG